MTSIVYRIGACGTGLDNIAVNEPRHRAKRGDGLRIAARNGGYETTISFNYLDCVNSDGSTLSRLHVRVARAAHTERPRHVPGRCHRRPPRYNHAHQRCHGARSCTTLHLHNRRICIPRCCPSSGHHLPGSAQPPITCQGARIATQIQAALVDASRLRAPMVLPRAQERLDVALGSARF